MANPPNHSQGFSFLPGLGNYQVPSGEPQTPSTPSYPQQSPSNDQFDSNATFQFPMGFSDFQQLGNPSFNPFQAVPYWFNNNNNTHNLNQNGINGNSPTYMAPHQQPPFSPLAPPPQSQPLQSQRRSFEGISDSMLKENAVQALRDLAKHGLSYEQVAAKLNAVHIGLEPFRELWDSTNKSTPTTPVDAPLKKPQPRPTVSREEYLARLKEAKSKKDPVPSPTAPSTPRKVTSEMNDEIKRRMALLTAKKKPATAESSKSPSIKLSVESDRRSSEKSPINSSNGLLTPSEPSASHRSLSAIIDTLPQVPGLNAVPSRPPLEPRESLSNILSTIPQPSVSQSNVSKVQPSPEPPADDSDLESGEIRSESALPEPPRSRPVPPRSFSAVEVSSTQPDSETQKRRLELEEQQAKLRAQIAFREQRKKMLQQKNLTKRVSPQESPEVAPAVTKEVNGLAKVDAPLPSDDSPIANGASSAISATRPTALKRHQTDIAALSIKRAKMAEMERELARMKAELELEMQAELDVQVDDETAEPNVDDNTNHAQAVLPLPLSGNAMQVESELNPKAIHTPALTEKDQASDGSDSNPDPSDSEDSSNSEEMDIDEEYTPETMIQQSPIHPLSNLIADDLVPELQPLPTPAPVKTKLKEDHDMFTPYISPLRDFRAYRYHPDYLSNVSQGFGSMTYTNRIDSNTPLCLNELEDGVCNDSDCPFQHFEDMEMAGDKILVDLGIECPFSDANSKAKWQQGLQDFSASLQADEDPIDSEEIARRLVEFRRKFIGDDSRVLNLGDEIQI